MASIVDVDNAPGDLEGLEKALSEAVVEQTKEDDNNDTENKDDAGNNVANSDPLAGTKFEGKSVDQILESYKNLESAYGRMANDLGTQRKLTDRLLDLKREDDLQSNAPQPVKLDGAELLDNPTEALDRYVSEREARIRKEYDDRLTQFEAQLQADRFMQKHPDFMTTGQSDEFQRWALATPVRAQVAQRASQGDWDAADALMTEYKEANNAAAAAAAPAADAGVADAKKVALESSNQAGAEGASSGRIYRRADLIDLKIRKPDVYGDPAFQAEILKAYSEGRVK